MKKATPATIRSVKPSTTPQNFFETSEYTLMTFLKLSSGVVVIGTDPDVQAKVLGGGFVLPSGVVFNQFFAPSTKLYIVGSTTGEAVSVSVQPLGYLLSLFLEKPMMPTGTQMPTPGTEEFKEFLAIQAALKTGAES